MSWRPTTREDVELAFLWSVAAACALVLVPLAPTFARLLPACPFHALTGIPCPGCGATRALLALGRGDLPGALGWNPLLAGTGLAFGAGGVAAPIWALGGGAVPIVRVTAPLRALAAGIVLANWIYLVARGV